MQSHLHSARPAARATVRPKPRERTQRIHLSCTASSHSNSHRSRPADKMRHGQRSRCKKCLEMIFSEYKAVSCHLYPLSLTWKCASQGMTNVNSAACL